MHFELDGLRSRGNAKQISQWNMGASNWQSCCYNRRATFSLAKYSVLGTFGMILESPIFHSGAILKFCPRASAFRFRFRPHPVSFCFFSQNFKFPIPIPIRFWFHCGTHGSETLFSSNFSCGGTFQHLKFELSEVFIFTTPTSVCPVVSEWPIPRLSLHSHSRMVLSDSDPFQKFSPKFPHSDSNSAILISFCFIMLTRNDSRVV